MGRAWRNTIRILLLTVLAGMLLWGGYRVMDHYYVFWNGMLISRTAPQADISGRRTENLEPLAELTELRQLDARNTELTPAQYAWLRQRLPDCTVLWDVPIQGERYPRETKAISVSALTEEEISLLAHLPELNCLDVGLWEDYAQIWRIRQQYPGCNVLYTVELAGERWGCDAVSVILENATMEELQERLPYLPALQSVFLTGTVPERQELTALMEAFPDIFFLWKMNVLGASVETDLQVLDISHTVLENARQLRDFLPYMPALEQVILNSEGLSGADLLALVKDYPQIDFRFEVPVAGKYFSSQAEEIDLSNVKLESVQEVEDMLPCFPRLKKVVMCECGIPSEEMDALNRRHENIRFVWSVNLAGVLFRTDAVHFAPNRWGLVLTDENIADLRYCTDMVCVDIGHALGVKSCEWAAQMPHLKYLVLAETSISDISPLSELKELVFLELFIMPVKDISPLLGCTALEDLNLCYTRADPAPVAQMPWLKRIWWSGHWPAKRDLPKLVTGDTQVECSSGSSTGKGWREGQHYYDMRDFIGMRYMYG